MPELDNSMLKPEEFSPAETVVTQGDQNAASEIIKEIEAEQSNILPPADSPNATGSPPATQEPLISEVECIAMLHTVYSLVAYSMNSDEPSASTIEMRGKQFFLISQRYGLTNIKYMDLMFFGVGIASDIAIMYKNKRPSKEEEKKKEELNSLSLQDQKRLETLPEPMQEMPLKPEQEYFL